VSSDTILARDLRIGDVVKRVGRPDTIVIELQKTDTHMLVTARSVLHYKLNDPVVVVFPRAET